MIENSPEPNRVSEASTPIAPPVDEQAYRAGIYSLLAALLRDYPNDDAIAFAAQLQGDATDTKSELSVAFSMLALAAQHTHSGALRDEYHALFIGLGRGELVPYGSWYQTGYLMERPLGVLRADLAALGFERDANVHEPEDHVAALFEVMGFLITDGAPFETQQRFFDRHIANWAERFFTDMAGAENAVFYTSVARLGGAFLNIERQYLGAFD